MVKRGIKKGNNLNSEDKDSNTGGTTGAHVRDTTLPKESTIPSRGASIDAHVSKQMNSCLVNRVL